MRKPKAQIFFYSRQGVPMFYRLEPNIEGFDLDDYAKKCDGSYNNLLELLLDDGIVVGVNSQKRGYVSSDGIIYED